MKLSILIPTLSGREREQFLRRVMSDIGTHPEVEILTDSRPKNIETGKKRNDLIQRCQGEYFCFVDDDDRVPKYYVQEMLKAISHNPDVITFKGYMMERGVRTNFTIRLGESYEARNGHIYRWPNHLCAFKKAMVTKFKFPEVWVGEDYKWSQSIHLSGVLKTEYHIDKDMYIYESVPHKKY